MGVFEARHRDLLQQRAAPIAQSQKAEVRRQNTLKLMTSEQ